MILFALWIVLLITFMIEPIQTAYDRRGKTRFILNIFTLSLFIATAMVGILWLFDPILKN